MFVFLVIVFASVAFATNRFESHTRAGAIACGLKYTDLDRDGKVSAAEVAHIRYLALGPYRKFAAPFVWLAERVPSVTGVVTVAQIMKDCGDKDGFITAQSYSENMETCLDTDGKIDDVYKYVCNQGEEGLFAGAEVPS